MTPPPSQHAFPFWFGTRSRRGFSAIELLTVLAVIVILVAVSTPTALTSIKRSRVTESAEAILRASQEARTLARLNGPKALLDDKAYGVVLVPGTNTTAGFATVTYGATADTSNELLNANGQPVARFAFHRSTTLFKDNNLLDPMAPLSWFYQPETGFPIRNRTDAKPVEIGVTYPAGTFASNGAATVASVVTIPQICTELSQRSLDGRVTASIRILSLGLGSVETTP